MNYAVVKLNLDGSRSTLATFPMEADACRYVASAANSSRLKIVKTFWKG
jgi:hypothetical protein